MKISQIIAADRIVVDVELASKKAVLERLADLLASSAPELKSKAVFDSLIARERLGTTGLGAGIAIPHGRVPIAGLPIGAFVRTTAPVHFDAVDGAPVDLFFALCVPTDANREHLDLLAALAARLTDTGFVARLRKAGAEEIARLFAKDPG